LYQGILVFSLQWALIFLVLPLAALLLYYWIALDEMRNQHPVRRSVWLVIVPICIFLVPMTYFLSLFPMVFFIALGEVYDKPKPEKIERIEEIKLDRWQKFVLAIIICVFLLYMIYPSIRHLFH